MSDWYILDGRTPVLEPDVLKATQWLEANRDKKVVKAETIGDVRVSTVFLGLDHGWGDGPPLLFETMIFGGPQDGYQDRCSTWQQAEDMHAKACQLVRSN